MQLIIRILLAVIAISCGWIILQQWNVYSYGVFDFFNNLPIIIIFITGILVFYIDFKNYLITRKLYQFIISFTCFVILVIYAAKLYDKSSVDKDMSVLTVVNQAGADRVFRFEFKQNGRLKITEYNMLGSDIYYCRYKKHADTLIIKNIPGCADANHLPTTGIIHHDSVLWNNWDTMLVNK